jgi:hypothetical protein
MPVGGGHCRGTACVMQGHMASVQCRHSLDLKGSLDVYGCDIHTYTPDRAPAVQIKPTMTSMFGSPALAAVRLSVTERCSGSWLHGNLVVHWVGQCLGTVHYGALILHGCRCAGVCCNAVSLAVVTLRLTGSTSHLTPGQTGRAVTCWPAVCRWTCSRLRQCSGDTAEGCPRMPELSPGLLVVEAGSLGGTTCGCHYCERWSDVLGTVAHGVWRHALLMCVYVGFVGVAWTGAHRQFCISVLGRLNLQACCDCWSFVEALYLGCTRGVFALTCMVHGLGSRSLQLTEVEIGSIRSGLWLCSCLWAASTTDATRGSIRICHRCRSERLPPPTPGPRYSGDRCCVCLDCRPDFPYPFVPLFKDRAASWVACAWG